MHPTSTCLHAIALVAFLLHPLANWGAQTGNTNESTNAAITLMQGDELRITFPSTPALDTVQRIRSDGRISLALIGELEAAGLSPAKLQETLVNLYGKELVSKEVNVVLVSRAFVVYVNGAVSTRGRATFDRPVDLFEAIMAAGFDDETANLKEVQVIRVENGAYTVHTENLQLILDGKQRQPFFLKPGDMILVRRRWI
jgi:polysaccharide biosynthesis/export protein